MVETDAPGEQAISARCGDAALRSTEQAGITTALTERTARACPAAAGVPPSSSANAETAIPVFTVTAHPSRRLTTVAVQDFLGADCGFYRSKRACATPASRPPRIGTVKSDGTGARLGCCGGLPWIGTKEHAARAMGSAFLLIMLALLALLLGALVWLISGDPLRTPSSTPVPKKSSTYDTDVPPPNR